MAGNTRRFLAALVQAAAATAYGTTGTPYKAGTVCSFNASITTTNMTVTSVTSGALTNGATVTGAGVTGGTTISSQTSGVPGGAGVYVVNNSQTVAAEPMSATVGTPFVDAAAADDLSSQGWVPVGVGSGTTAQRIPASAAGAGQFFVDTTLSKAIVSDGVSWRDPVTGLIV